MHEGLPKEIVGSVSRTGEEALRAEKGPSSTSLLPSQSSSEPPRKRHDEKTCHAGSSIGDNSARAKRTVASPALLFRFDPDRRPGGDEGEICVDRWTAAARRFSGYEPDLGRMERLLPLRRRDLHLRFRGD